MKISLIILITGLLICPLMVFAQPDIPSKTKIVIDSTTVKPEEIIVPTVTSFKVSGSITNPLSGESFFDLINVSGWIKNLSKNKYIWLLNCPQESVECWPQFKNITINPSTGKFEAKAQIGGQPDLSHDIKLVMVDYETHILFSNYIRTGSFDNGIFLPEDLETLANVTVIKKDKSKQILYGVTTSGMFFIHKSLIDEINGSTPYLRSSLDGWNTDYEMKLIDEYYTVRLSTKKELNRKISYAIKVGPNKFIPHALLDVFSDLINEDDCVSTELGGYNFHTMPLNQAPF